MTKKPKERKKYKLQDIFQEYLQRPFNRKLQYMYINLVKDDHILLSNAKPSRFEFGDIRFSIGVVNLLNEEEKAIFTEFLKLFDFKKNKCYVFYINEFTAFMNKLKWNFDGVVIEHIDNNIYINKDDVKKRICGICDEFFIISSIITEYEKSINEFFDNTLNPKVKITIPKNTNSFVHKQEPEELSILNLNNEYNQLSFLFVAGNNILKPLNDTTEIYIVYYKVKDESGIRYGAYVREENYVEMYDVRCLSFVIPKKKGTV